MEIKLKKFELLIRETSKVSNEDILNYLKKVFNNIEKNNNADKKTFGFSAVFDARTSEYYLYYSDKAKEFYKMTKNRYDLVPKGIVTRNNFMDTLKSNIGDIKKLLFSSIRIITEKLAINKKGEATLSSEALGDIIFNTAEVEQENYYEDYIVTLKDGHTVSGLPPEEVGKKVIVSYLSDFSKD